MSLVVDTRVAIKWFVPEIYLVLAQQLEGKMVTADKKLYLVLETHPEWSGHLLWIEDVPFKI